MKARLKFSKAGTMKFIGHLDVMRYFQKAFRRAEIDVTYSQGYSPHQLLSFASPLGVGLTSDGEYLDMQLNSVYSEEEMIEKINSAMNDEIQAVSFHVLPDDSKNAMSIVAGADYLISVKDGYPVMEDFQKRFEEFLQQESIVIVKKTKKSEKEIDIRPLIYKYTFDVSYDHSVADQYDNDNVVKLRLCAGSAENLKPELVMHAFCNYCNVEFNEYAYQMHRYDMYALDADNNLVSLDSFGIN